MARTTTTFEYELTFNSTIKGHHKSKNFYKSSATDRLQCLPDASPAAQEIDPDAIGVMKDEKVIGHVPIQLTSLLTHFLKGGHGTIVANPTGKRFFGHGLEIPCKYILTGEKYRHLQIVKAELQNIDGNFLI